MVNIRQLVAEPSRPTGARPVDYAPASPDAPFECFTFAELRSRVGAAEIGDLQLLHFDMLIACRSGEGRHEVDFETTRIDRHRWLHIRAGQVHRWISADDDADLVLLAPRSTSPHWRSGPRIIELDDDELDDLDPLLELLRFRRRSDVGMATLLAMRDLVVRWLALDRPDDLPDEPLYGEFRRLLDRDVHRWRNVEEYAARLGCSSRTLARCCERAGSATPKQLIDGAVVLEAQRLLALPGATVAMASVALGFDEPTNFTKFFKRVGGTTPTAWQVEHQRMRGASGAAPAIRPPR